MFAHCSTHTHAAQRIAYHHQHRAQGCGEASGAPSIRGNPHVLAPHPSHGADAARLRAAGRALVASPFQALRLRAQG
jgi:hypothetical protein